MGRLLQNAKFQLFGKPHVERKPRKRPASDVPTEDQEQRIVGEWLNARRLLWFHPPMGGIRDKISAARMKSLGARAGVPDILILDPPEGLLGIVGVAIEMKRRGSTASAVGPLQREWLDALAKRGWKTTVARGADEAISFLENLYGRCVR